MTLSRQHRHKNRRNWTEAHQEPRKSGVERQTCDECRRQGWDYDLIGGCPHWSSKDRP